MDIGKFIRDLIAPKEVGPFRPVPGTNSERFAAPLVSDTPSFTGSQTDKSGNYFGFGGLDAIREERQAGSGIPDAQDPRQEMLSNIMEMILGSGGGSTLTASQAAGAYSPLIAALDSEKAAAKSRAKSNKWESAKDFKGIENQYRLERRNAVKNNVLAKEKLNKEIAKNKTATRQEYTKQAAENSAEMEAMGIGSSAQAMARQSLEQRATEEANMQESIATENANNRREMQRAQEAYLGEQLPVTRQAREEADMGYSNLLENTLLGLNKEQAGVRAQAASAANSVRASQQDNSLKKAASMMDLLRLTGELSTTGDPSITQFFPKGVSGALEWGAAKPIPRGEEIQQTILADQEFQNGGFGNPENRIPLNSANVAARISEYATQKGWTPAERKYAIEFAERALGLYGDRKNEPSGN
jgi:hypothetical protein